MGILELSDCPASAVRDLIDYLYTSRLNITQDGARDLLSVAVRLELASAQQAVEMFLRMRMTTPVAIQTLRVSFRSNYFSLAFLLFWYNCFWGVASSSRIIISVLDRYEKA